MRRRRDPTTGRSHERAGECGVRVRRAARDTRGGAFVLSLAELRRAARAVERRFAGFRVERIAQPDAFRVALTFHGRADGDDRSGRRCLVLSCDPAFARVGELERAPASAERPPAFLQFLRPRIEGARLRSARIAGEDRQLVLVFDGADASFDVLLSLLGRRSNCYVIASDGRLLAAQRPLEQTRRSLRIGEPWEAPPEPAPREGDDRFAAEDDDALLRAIEAAYAGSEDERTSDALGARVAKALRKERKAAEKRVERIDAELAEAEHAGDLQRHGELLKGALARVEPGMREIEVADYATGEPVRIPLDPALSPKQNLEATFKRYQKLIRRLAKAGAQSEEARAGLAALTALEDELSARVAANDADGVARLAERADVAKLVRKHLAEVPPAAALPAKRAPKGPFDEVPRRLQPRRYRSADGLEIWVGRSDEGNDHLSTRLARGNDLFFHLDGAPGSHVVLRTEGRSDPPSESLLDACELAVHFSKFRNAGSADVHVAPIKNVKKPKGAKRGLVYVTGGRSIRLRREEARLARLLASVVPD